MFTTQRSLKQPKREDGMNACDELLTKDFLEKSLRKLKKEIIQELHETFGRVEDQLKLFIEIQSKTIQRYDQIEKVK